MPKRDSKHTLALAVIGAPGHALLAQRAGRQAGLRLHQCAIVHFAAPDRSMPAGLVIDGERSEDFACAARHINELAVDAVWLGLDDSLLGSVASQLFELLRRLAAPLVVVLPAMEDASLARHRGALSMIGARAATMIVPDAATASQLAALCGWTSDHVVVVPPAALVAHMRQWRPAAATPAALAVPNLATPGFGAIRQLSSNTGLAETPAAKVYRLEDNARALMLMGLADGVPLAERQRLASHYAAFVDGAWDEERGAFIGDHATQGDHDDVVDQAGRAIWALGHAAAHAPDAGLAAWARQRYDQAIARFDGADSPRALAYAMLGALSALAADPWHEASRTLLHNGATVLNALLDDSRRPDWAWFEAVLGHDNPRLSQALLGAAAHWNRSDWRDSALSSLRFIVAQQTAPSGHFRAIGTQSSALEHEALPFDQQPREALAAIEAAAQAFALTGERVWLDHAHAAYGWFFGANDRGVVLADLARGDCRDGITPRGPGAAGRAESVLSLQLAHYALQALAGQARGARARPWAAAGHQRPGLSTWTG